MESVMIKMGSLSVYTLSFFIVLGFFWYSFILYKKGQEYYYNEDDLLDFGVLSGVWGWLFSRLGFVIGNWDVFKANLLRVLFVFEYPGYSYLGLLVGLIGVNWYMAKKEAVKFFEGLDLLGLALPVALAFERIGRVLAGEMTLFHGLPLEVFQALFGLLIFILLWKVEFEYRTFEWYRFHKTQARSGFVFGSFLFLSSFLFLTAAFLPMFSWINLMVGMIFNLGGIVFIYLRSGRNLNHDLRLLGKPFGVYTKTHARS